MKPILIIILTLLTILALSMVINAQPSLPTGPSQAPIDGGLGVLAAAGGTYALKKLRDRKRESEQQNEL